MTNYYQVLAIQSNASTEEIRQAYRSLAKKYHPDVNNQSQWAEQKFKEIQEAYSILSDKNRKTLYDYQWQIYNQPQINNTQKTDNQSSINWTEYVRQQAVREKYQAELRKEEQKNNIKTTFLAIGFLIVAVILLFVLGYIMLKILGAYFLILSFLGIMIVIFIWQSILQYQKFRKNN